MMFVLENLSINEFDSMKEFFQQATSGSALRKFLVKLTIIYTLLMVPIYWFQVLNMTTSSITLYSSVVVMLYMVNKRSNASTTCDLTSKDEFIQLYSDNNQVWVVKEGGMIVGALSVVLHRTHRPWNDGGPIGQELRHDDFVVSAEIKRFCLLPHYWDTNAPQLLLEEMLQYIQTHRERRGILTEKIFRIEQDRNVKERMFLSQRFKLTRSWINSKYFGLLRLETNYFEKTLLTS